LLYTVGFQPTAASKNLLTNCATKPDMYFESPSKTTLSDIFQAIAFDLIEVRIAR
jgi:hypothetical protein